MRARPLTALAASAAALTVAVFTGPVATASPGTAAGQSRTAPARTALASAAAPTAGHTRRACAGRPHPGQDQCLALINTNAAGRPLVWHPSATATLPLGYGPAQLWSAYKLAKAAASAGAGQTVAVVDAFDDPSAEADLTAYRAEYGLPPCTSASGCFTKVNQDGATAPLPAPDAGWAVEESLDIEMVSAICPNCHIILAEASSATDTDVASTVATAARLGATEISNSYGEPEYPGETRLDPFYDQPGIQLTASAGDDGYGVGYPAASAQVTSVGGTALVTDPASSRHWAETAWAGTGSGCSTQIARPAWQHDSCTHRADNDVAAVAAPTTPVAIYDTFGAGGWMTAGGTSVAAPIVAAVYALLGDPKAAGGSYFYQHRTRLFDVASGADGSCSPAWLCTARPGYDGPTGLGSPDFTGARATSVNCTSDWALTPAPKVPSLAELVTERAGLAYQGAIAALPPHTAWTVGGYQTADPSGPAASTGWVATTNRWNGTSWSPVPAANVANSYGGGFTQLDAVSFDSPRDGWAAGTQADSAVVEHWDGTRWTLSPVLTPTASYINITGQTALTQAVPSAVDAISPDDVWVAGPEVEAQANPVIAAGSFLEHWDGASWSLASFPGADRLWLFGLHAISANDVWAVGSGLDATGGGTGTAALHWDGTSWSAVPTVRATAGTVLTSVSGTSASDVWAVGYFSAPATGKQLPFAEHWNGSAWSVVPVAQPRSFGITGNGLFAVTAVSATDVWAVGDYSWTRASQIQLGLPLLEHWDGHSWSLVSTPDVANPTGLYAVSATSAANVWAAGGQQTGLSGLGAANMPLAIRHGCGHAG